MKTVAIIIPCRNEEAYIGKCLDSLLANDYPSDLLEIIIVDGMSEDGTRNIIKGYCNKHKFIKVIENPWLIKPIALNIGIKSTNTDVVMRIDAHSIYAENYISSLVRTLYENDADNVGGIRETYIGSGPIEKSIAVGISHPFSVGLSYWRTGVNKIKNVNTVYCGCYKRNVFSRIGYFNEKLIRAQDKEFNSRLIEAGGKILCDPSVRCYYFPRKTMGGYIKWNYSGAKWLFTARKYTKSRMVSMANFVPLAFLIYTFTGIFVSLLIIDPVKYILLIPLLMYLLVVSIAAIRYAWKQNDLWCLPFVFMIFPLTHYSYAVGSLVGLFHEIFPKRCDYEK